jgi:flagellar export protein FliJ
MSQDRLRRMGRLVDVRVRAVDVVEMELAQLVRRLADAKEAVRRAHGAWEAAASVPAPPTCTSADLHDAHAHLLGLRRRIETLAAQERQVRLLEEASRSRLLAAKTELKKIETWRDRLVDAVRAEEDAQERKATDQVAARIAGGA